MLYILLIIAAGLVLVCIGLMRKGEPKPRDLTHQQVVAAIANALDLDDSGYHDEFDLFVGQPISNPYFESLRLEILAIGKSEGRPNPKKDFGPLAEAWLNRMYTELTRNGT